MRLRHASLWVLFAVVPSVSPAQTLDVSFEPVRQAALPASRWAAIAFFSAERVFGESGIGKRAIGELNALRDRRSAEGAERARALKAEREQLEVGAALLSEQARAQALKKIERFEVDMQRFLQDAQAEFQARQEELEAGFRRRLADAVERLAKDRALQLVFDRSTSGLFWADPMLDISEELVAQLDRASSTP